MAGMGVTFVGVPDGGDETDSPQAEASEAAAEDTETPGETEQDSDPAEAENADEPDADEAAEEVADEAESKLGSYEQSVVDSLKSHPDFKGVAKRVAKAFELSVSRREALKEKESELAAKETTVKELEARLQETAEKVAAAPAGPLAHLADEQALSGEVEKCVEFLKWVKNTPDAASHYRDTADQTAEEQLEANQRYALYVLENQGKQREVLKQRQTIRAEVKQQRRTLFDPRHEDHRTLTELYQSDPRTRSDFDQWIADALRGRQIREAAAKAPAKESPAAKAPLKEVKKVSKADLPAPKTVSSLPLRGGVLGDAEKAAAKLKQGGRLSFDEMADSGLMSRRVA